MLFDMDKIGEDNAYKLLVSTVAPRPIAWVSTRDVDGSVNAAPFSFFNAVSGRPPIICFGIGGRGPGDAKDTGNIIRRTGDFVVNLVDRANTEKMVVTAIEFAPEVDEFKEAGLTPVAASKVKAPRIAESPVSMECERLVIIDVGVDRAVVLGKVVAMHIRDDCVLDPVKFYIDTPKLDLVGRMHGGGWYSRTTDRFEVPRIEVADWFARKSKAAE
jgi:flavin reductase (DIM6/NTAB) family NADH-FMN oxidoreductase RutF